MTLIWRVLSRVRLTSGGRLPGTGVSATYSSVYMCYREAGYCCSSVLIRAWLPTPAWPAYAGNMSPSWLTQWPGHSSRVTVAGTAVAGLAVASGQV